MDIKVSANAADKPDFIARYFLRRLAMAHRHSPSRKSSIQFTNALVDTILVFVGLPILGLLGIVMLSSLRWAPQILMNGPDFSQLSFGITLWIVSLVIGHLWLGPRLKKYKEYNSAYSEFASARDARIVSWQRLIVFVVCAMVLPLLTLFVTFHI
jgi:hypothetical protein